VYHRITKAVNARIALLALMDEGRNCHHTKYTGVIRRKNLTVPHRFNFIGLEVSPARLAVAGR